MSDDGDDTAPMSDDGDDLCDKVMSLFGDLLHSDDATYDIDEEALTVHTRELVEIIGSTPRQTPEVEASSTMTTQLVELPEFPPATGHTIFQVSADEQPPPNKTDTQRHDREVRNTDKARHREKERVEAEHRRDRIHRNLIEAFDVVDGRHMPKTPSANVAVARFAIEAMANNTP